MKRVVLAVAAVLVLLTPIEATASAPAPHFVMWSGELLPHTPATGVELRADGKLRRLTADGAGRIHPGGWLSVSRSKVTAMRTAAEALLVHGPNGSHARIFDGPYLTVDLDDGTHRRLVTDTGADSARVVALLARVNAALPARGRLFGAAGELARAAKPSRSAYAARPDTPAADGDDESEGVVVSPAPPATCPEGVRPEPTIEKDLTFEEAVRYGFVTKVAPKGGLSGDDISVSAVRKNVAPTNITFAAQVSVEGNGLDAQAIADKFRSQLETAYSSFTVNGSPVRFHFDISAHLPPEPTKCVSQILITEHGAGLTGKPNSYIFFEDNSIVIDQRNVANPDHIVHEVAHALGIVDEHYQIVFRPNDGRPDIPMPGVPHSDAELQAWLTPHDITLAEGLPKTRPRPADKTGSYDDDVMASSGHRVRPQDMAAVAADAEIVITAQPGLLLGNKDLEDQNMAIGAPFELRIHPGESSAQLDGMVAYCIDLARHAPGSEGRHAGFDVLGRAGDVGTPQMDALQRVLDVVAAREPGPLLETPSANEAIWRVTDDLPIEDDDTYGASIVQAAGISPNPADGQTFAAPHFDDPAAAIPHPVAFASPSDAAPLPDLAPPAATDPAALPPVAKLARVKLRSRTLRLHRRRVAVIVADVLLDGAPDRVSLALTRARGRRTVTVARARARTVAPGHTLLVLVVKRAKPGAYRLLARGAHGGSVSTAVRLKR